MADMAISGKKISEEEFVARYEKAMALKGCACFDNCATYPFCKRLSDQVIFDKIVALKEVAERTAKNVLKQGFDEKDFEVDIKIYCLEHKNVGIDLGD